MLIFAFIFVVLFFIIVLIFTSKLKEQKIKSLYEKVENQNQKIDLLNLKLSESQDKLFKEGVRTKSTSFIHEQIEKIETLEVDLESCKKRILDAKKIAQDANMVKYDFMSNIRHEVRTPMNSILVFADMLRCKVTDTTQVNYADNILKSGHKLLNLIDKMIEISNLESGSFTLTEKAVDVTLFFNNIIEFQRKKAQKKGLKLILKVDENVPDSLLIDDEKIQDILENLIDNAIKFTKEGMVQVFVNISNPNIVNNTVDLVISVKDTGMGINFKNQKKIFEVFEKRENANEVEYQGTGLGLSINRKIARQMDGDITLQSEEEKGSEFLLELKNIEVVLVDNKSINKECVDFSVICSAKIMVVDEAEENRVIFSECFNGTNVEVFHFNNPRSAIEALKENSFDFIFMDVDLLQTDDGAVSTVMAKISNAPVVSLTTQALKNINFVENGLKVVGHVKKPISKFELFKICIKVLNSSHLLKENKEIMQELNMFENLEPTNINEFLMQELQEISDLYKNAKETNDLQQTKKFAKLLLKTAQKFKIHYFVDYANKLLTKVDFFDIEAISELMDDYINLINLLKKKAK